MEILFIGLSYLADYYRPLMWVILIFLFCSGVYLSTRGYWIYKRRLRVAGAISGVVLGFLLCTFFIFGLQIENNEGLFGNAVFSTGNVYSNVVLSFSVITLLALLGYFTAYQTFIISLVLWGALAGYLIGNFISFGRLELLSGLWVYPEWYSVLFALAGGYLAYLSLRTFIILATAFMGAYLAASILAFYFLDGYSKLDDYIRAYERIKDIFEIKRDADAGALWISFLDGKYSRITNVKPFELKSAAYYYVYVYVVTTVFAFYGIHYQVEYAHKQALRENEQLRDRLGMTGMDESVSLAKVEPQKANRLEQGLGGLALRLQAILKALPARMKRWRIYRFFSDKLAWLWSQLKMRSVQLQQFAATAIRKNKVRMDEKTAVEGGYQAYAQNRIQPVLAAIRRQSVKWWQQVLPLLKQAGDKAQAAFNQLQQQIKRAKRKHIDK